MDSIVVVDGSTSSSQTSSSTSSYSGESAVGDPVPVKRRRKTKKHESESKPSMSIPLHGGFAAVGASCGNTSVAATGGSESPPFEDESQEGQLDTLRTAVREHGRNGGGPPSVPAGNESANSRHDEKKQKSKILHPDPGVDPGPRRLLGIKLGLG